jgi:hypothetical protein
MGNPIDARGAKSPPMVGLALNIVRIRVGCSAEIDPLLHAFAEKKAVWDRKLAATMRGRRHHQKNVLVGPVMKP